MTMSKQDNKIEKSGKSIMKTKLTKFSENHYYDSDHSKNNYDDDEELLRKLNIPFDDESIITPSMSLMTLASALPDTDFVDSTGDNVNSKSSSFYDYEGANTYNEDDDDVDYSEYNFENDDEGSCNTKFNYKIYRDVINDMPMMEKKKYKNGTRSSLTFSNQRVKEIERDNRILLEKIMRNGPSGDSFIKQKSTTNKNRTKVRSAAEVNRLRKQQQIIYENQILKRKLEKIASRRASISN